MLPKSRNNSWGKKKIDKVKRLGGDTGEGDALGKEL